MIGPRAVVGTCDSNGFLTLVTVSDTEGLLDRRTIDLVDPGLPRHPHHHEGQGLPVDEAVALVGQVQASATRRARAALDELARDVPVQLVGISLRSFPELPPGVAERITDYRTQCYADSAMYRLTMAEAATERGWSTGYYDKHLVLATAAAALGVADLAACLKQLGKTVGPPWRAEHKVSLAAGVSLLAKNPHPGGTFCPWFPRD